MKVYRESKSSNKKCNVYLPNAVYDAIANGPELKLSAPDIESVHWAMISRKTDDGHECLYDLLYKAGDDNVQTMSKKFFREHIASKMLIDGESLPVKKVEQRLIDAQYFIPSVYKETMEPLEKIDISFKETDMLDLFAAFAAANGLEPEKPASPKKPVKKTEPVSPKNTVKTEKRAAEPTSAKKSKTKEESPEELIDDLLEKLHAAGIFTIADAERRLEGFDEEPECPLADYVIASECQKDVEYAIEPGNAYTVLKEMNKQGIVDFNDSTEKMVAACATAIIKDLNPIQKLRAVLRAKTDNVDTKKISPLSIL